MATFSHLYSSALDRELGTDDSTTLFTTARRKAGINEGMQEFADLTGCYQRRSTVTVTGGTAEYDLHSTAILPGGDFVRLSKDAVWLRYVNASSNVTVIAGDDLPRRDVPWLNANEPDWQHSTVSTATGQQLPSVFYTRANGGQQLLGFWPTPSTGSSATCEAYVTYHALPAVMTSDSDEPFSSASTAVRQDVRIYHQALAHYGAYQLEKLRRDDQASDRQLQRFMGYVARYLQANRLPGGQHVTAARRYFTPRGAARGTDPRT